MFRQLGDSGLQEKDNERYSFLNSRRVNNISILTLVGTAQGNFQSAMS